MARFSAAVVALAALLLAGCVGPSRTDRDYREKAANAAESMVSVVETARLTVESDARGNSTARYTSLSLSEGEDDASSIAMSFEVVQPPSRDAEQLRTDLSSLFSEVSTVLGDLRIAARAGRGHELPSIAEPLPELTARLKKFMELAST
ncbi:MAG TPA: hypothetical protein VM345_14475 [Acidimicrobiales bacterium]|jgi:hypothetical protein|nr:hypothetical protein [Acidimicrobiales bacterium]